MAVTMDSKMKEVFSSPEAVAILEDISPGITKNPAIKMIFGMTLRTAASFPQAGFTPEMLAELEERINALS